MLACNEQSICTKISVSNNFCSNRLHHSRKSQPSPLISFRPFKMNTAEAIAACLYISGFKDLARVLLDPFGYDILNGTALCVIRSIS
jgi:hypothetical protein